jgi:autotransporter-associated beta strand protein
MFPSGRQLSQIRARRARRALLISAGTAVGATLTLLDTHAAKAGAVSLTGSDSIGSSSFNSSGNWSNGLAPSSANDYSVNNFNLRTPTDSGNTAYTFAGNSLTLLGGSGTLLVKGNSTDTVIVNNLTIGNATTGGIVLGSGNAFTFTLAGNGITLGAAGGTLNANLAAAGIIVSENITGNGPLTVTNGLTELLGSNSYGNTTISTNTTLQIGNGGAGASLSGTGSILDNGTLVFDSSGNLTQETNFGTMSASSGGNLTQNGAGTLVLNAANSYHGNTTVNSGTLSLAATGTNAAVSSSSALVLGGGTLSDSGVSTGNQTFSGLTVNSGGSAVTTASGIGHTLALGAISRNTGGTVDFTPFATTGSGSITTSTANANPSGGQPTILGGWAVYGTTAGTPTTWAVSGATGTNPITGLSSFNSSAALASGSDADAPAGTDTAGSAGTSLTINSLRFNGSSGPTTIAVGGNSSSSAFTIATGGILETSAVGNNAVAIASGGSGGTNTLTSGNTQDLIVNQYNTANNLTISLPITGSIAVTESGPGTLVLSSGSNSYSNGTIVNGGVVSVSADANLGTAPSTPTTNITLNGGTLQLNTLVETTFNGNRSVNLGAAGGTINIPNATTSGNLSLGTEVAPIYKGNIAGTGALTISGGGGTNTASAPYLLVLNDSGNTSYGGTTTVNNATVVPTAAGGSSANLLPAGTVLNIVNHGIFGLNGGTVSTQTLAGLTGDSTTQLTNIAGSGLATYTVNTAAGTSYAYDGVIAPETVLLRGGSAPIAIVKTGPGTQILTNGSNSLAGNVIVSAGTLLVNNGTTGSAAGTGNISVSPAVAGTANYSGARFGGNGTVTGTVTLASSTTATLGGIIVAGANDSTIGTLSSGNQTWGGGAAYEWKIANAGTSAAWGSGNSTSGSWDDVKMSGLSIASGGSNQPFTIALDSLSSPSGSGNFSWIIAQTTSAPTGLSGAAAPPGANLLTLTPTGSAATGSPSSYAVFALDTSGFGNGFSLNGGDTNNFSLEFISNGGNGENLVLDYNSAPEPGAGLLALAGGLPMLLARRRRAAPNGLRTICNSRTRIEDLP